MTLVCDDGGDDESSIVRFISTVEVDGGGRGRGLPASSPNRPVVCMCSYVGGRVFNWFIHTSWNSNG